MATSGNCQPPLWRSLGSLRLKLPSQCWNAAHLRPWLHSHVFARNCKHVARVDQRFIPKTTSRPLASPGVAGEAMREELGTRTALWDTVLVMGEERRDAAEMRLLSTPVCGTRFGCNNCLDNPCSVLGYIIEICLDWVRFLFEGTLFGAPCCIDCNCRRNNTKYFMVEHLCAVSILGGSFDGTPCNKI